jgi:hypothetical protein
MCGASDLGWIEPVAFEAHGAVSPALQPGLHLLGFGI